MVLYCFLYNVTHLQTVFYFFVQNLSLFFELLKNVHKKTYLQDFSLKFGINIRQYHFFLILWANEYDSLGLFMMEF